MLLLYWLGRAESQSKFLYQGRKKVVEILSHRRMGEHLAGEILRRHVAVHRHLDEVNKFMRLAAEKRCAKDAPVSCWDGFDPNRHIDKSRCNRKRFSPVIAPVPAPALR